MFNNTGYPHSQYGDYGAYQHSGQYDQQLAAAQQAAISAMNLSNYSAASNQANSSGYQNISQSSSGYSNSRENSGRLSNDTSSRDPADLAARIFVGNVNQSNSRDDIIESCRPFGRLKAVAMFKGYAFVQYTTPAEAELAVQGLHGYSLKGSKLDVRIVSIQRINQSDAVKKQVEVKQQIIRRPKNDFFFGGVKIKPEAVNHRNRVLAAQQHKDLIKMDFYDHGESDTLICGTCKSLFTKINDYLDHRKNPCDFFEKDMCPSQLSCFTCNAQFKESWQFLQHLVHKHSINLYKNQPKSNPASYQEKYGEDIVPPSESEDEESENGDSKDEDKADEESSLKRAAEKESSNEPEAKQARLNGTNSPALQVINQEPEPATGFAQVANELFFNPAGVVPQPIPNFPVQQPPNFPAPQPLYSLCPQPVFLQQSHPEVRTGLTEEEQLRMLDEFN